VIRFFRSHKSSVLSKCFDRTDFEGHSLGRSPRKIVSQLESFHVNQR